jgi:5-methylcytosine-specific restriction endonuclease McrA
MMIVTLVDLPDEALTRRLVEIRKQERSLLVEFLRYLAELDRRKTVVVQGYPSLFSFCTDFLGLSKGSAFRRTTAARLLARFPLVAEYLADGRLNLTTLVELRDVLDEAHLVEILERAADRTEEQVKELVAALRPQAAPADLLRKLPDRRNDCSGSGPKPSIANTIEPALAPLPPPASALVAAPGASPSVEPARAPLPPPASALVAAPAARPWVAVRPDARSAARLEPIAPERHVLRVTVGSDFVADLEAVRQALSHKLPGGGLEEVLHECLRVTLAQVERRRFGADKKSSATEPPPGSRYVPVAVRKEVWKRDGGCCAFVGSTGRRCDSRHQVELHHLDPFAMGGRATAANLTLRCRVHNHHAAEQDYGAEHIARKVASHHARRDAGTAPTIPGLVD